ncbi:hypothetical protein FO440_23670 [Mucilaginibacter corticis]|uniref:BamA/TamA family outer membrane protein n=1 Tax=Mucilaginibacter corticis TaxID=2597670 RepID=A0A556M7M7_9SPHI|nr:hypothetical protein [Mucilaginibacter corticis]TSJ35922.1 hypothetical protein FO440_23670 [Mucilaginibacter corticis]
MTSCDAFAQLPAVLNEKLTDSVKQRDLADLFGKLLHIKENEDEHESSKKADFSFIPSVGYSLTTGFNGDISANVGFFTQAKYQQNLSEIDGSLTYDTKNQKEFVARSEIWIAADHYKIVTDTRFEQFPEDTYGFGTLTTEAQANPIDFKYVRTYLTIYRKLLPDLYAGTGVNMDHHFDITQKGNILHTITDFQKYGFSSGSFSSGINLDLLYDSRRNPINPTGGAYASLIYRDNAKITGSNSNWQSLQLDLRRYFKLSARSNNVLAFWTMVWLTNGDTPYLDLPGTGLDMFNNTGRGYIDGRFIGKNMIYAEGEYRFGISRDGLLGGVVFANGESLTELAGNSFRKIIPAAGAGLRVKVNKHSNTNICIDYAVGCYGSNGLFLNLGEIF